MEHKCEKTKDIDRLVAINDEQSKAIEERVKWTMFWAILLVLFGLLGTIFNNIYSQIDEIDSTEVDFHKEMDAKVNETKIAQAKIDVQYADIMSKLAEINLKLSKIK